MARRGVDKAQTGAASSQELSQQSESREQRLKRRQQKIEEDSQPQIFSDFEIKQQWAQEQQRLQREKEKAAGDWSLQRSVVARVTYRLTVERWFRGCRHSSFRGHVERSGHRS